MQSSLHSSMQTNLRTSDAKLFAMKSIGDQAREFRLWKGWNYTEMAAEVQKHFKDGEVSRQKITQLEEAGARRPRYLAALAKAMGTTVEILEAGLWRPVEGAPSTPESREAGNVVSAPASMRPRRYPVISSVQAGEWCEIVDHFAPGDAEDWQDSPVDLGPNGFILKLEGDSMTNPAGGKDNFPEGMYVHVHPGIEAQPGDYVIAKREHENKATFKKLVRVDGEHYLHAINPAWPKPYIKLEPGDRIIGKLKFAGWSF